jgi:glycosyltransferase involved in cell wall biosynthesis
MLIGFDMSIKQDNVQGRPIVLQAPRKVKKILVSIITVCRNSEKTIAQTIESVLNQTYSHLEYIIIDGASTDRTIEIIKRYESKFKGRMRWISEQDAGMYDAMNKGIALAAGELIGILNADDWYEDDSIKKIIEAHRKYGDVIFYGIARYIENDKELMLKTTNYQFLDREMLPHPTCFVPKNIYQRYGGYNVQCQIAADYELLLRFYFQGVRFVQIDEVLANFRTGGITTTQDMQCAIETFRIRYQYGFISKRQLYIAIIKKKILSFLVMIGIMEIKI